MQNIPVKIIDDVVYPSEPIPDNALAVVCDGENYIIYFEGDELPPAPEQD